MSEVKVCSDDRPAEAIEDPPLAHEECPRLVELVRSAGGELVATITGREEPVADVRVARCFPWSMPAGLISIRDKDGNELVLLAALDELPEPTRELIEQELRDKIFAPRIERILSYQNRFGIATFRALTDRGEVTFQLRTRDDVRVLSSRRCILKDVDGNVYEVRDVEQLDRQSREHLSDFF